ncbi:MAG: hypothetical protein QOD39_5422, partial [Mycobacterium sp.]|nr:hypothetical protein [Mycobacterium sp.]
MAAHYDVVVTVGDPTSVRAQGDPAALDLLDIHTEGDTLVAAVKSNVQWPANARVTLNVTTPTLAAGEIKGSGEMRIGAVHADALSLDLDGSGDVDAQELTLKKLTVTSGGSGEVNAGGIADEADIRLSGSGDAELTSLTVKRADVSVSGSGSLSIEATERV